MKKTKENPILLTIKGKDIYLVARINLWKAYLIAADVEKHQQEISALEEKRKKFLKI